VYLRERSRNANIEVVLTGRPYQILCPDMNKGIPDIFASLGIKTFYQDMLPRFTELDGRSPPISAREIIGEIEQEVRPLLDAVHWHYAARILETAAFCVASRGLYPVLITAFKCSPDSFVIEYFKKILDAHKKPYLILQIDDHDSSVGYETRIEAGIRSFANHASSKPGITSGVKEVPVVNTFHPKLDFELEGRTLLFPNWDRLTIPLVVANLRSAGVDARVLEEDELSIQKSTRLNSGQCLPINAITQSMVDYIKKYDLDPSRTLLWMVASIWSCNIHLFPQHIKSLLDAYGGGMEKAGVYVGDLSHSDISPLLAIGAYFAYLFGGLLRKLGCRIRPYELIGGQTDAAVVAVLKIFEQAFLGQRSREDALAEAIEIFEAIPKTEDHRPKVAIFGDLYVRDNDMMNQGLIAFIEQIGGEVVTTPYSEYLRIVADATFKKWRKENRYFVLAKYRTILALVKLAEKKFFSYYGDYLSSAASFRNPRAEESLGRFNVRLEHQGESWDNLLKICHLVKEYPDLRLFVQTNPVFCCPSLVTEAMTRRIEEITGVPVVTLTYDGTGSFKNDKIVPYLAEARAADKASSPVSIVASGVR